MCGQPARTVGWRDPGFIHTSFLKELWPNMSLREGFGLKGSSSSSNRAVSSSSPPTVQPSMRHVPL
ncbi:putative phosphodiesterase I [Medicago truncatula]|uniref:Putative phosphodiesterase I n=1 Tax=Medicago truncatula TaxID=3880 RepID=A0A396HEM8_MEDTR|nr:putative phosphodiesterase I [Medicago truncatula]